MTVPPYPIEAQVTAYDAKNDSVTVMIRSGQMPLVSVQRLYHGASDGLRINKKPLPTRGSWGLVVFPNGDIRNGIWLGSFNPNQQNAIPSDQNDPFMDYESHWSGHWNMLDQSGNHTTVFADGSSMCVSASGTVPKVYRNIVNKSQEQERIEFTQKDRRPDPPPPFPFTYTQATSGDNGGTTIAVDASGNVNIGLKGTHTINISQAGGETTDFLTLVSKLVTAFNNHTHKNSGGSGTGGTPTTNWTANTVKSSIINISNQ